MSILPIMRRTLFALVLAAAAAATAVAQQPSHPTSTPYRGDLSIFETPGRDERLHTDRILNMLEIGNGKVVADIGAGSGWFTVRAAQRVGRKGAVIAEDINPDAIASIQQRAEKEKLPQVKTVLGTPDDPKLEPNTVDVALMLKMYHEIAHTAPVLASIHAALKPGGRLGIIDRNGTGSDHGLNEAIVKKEVIAAGFKLVGRYDFTRDDGEDYFLIFTPIE